VLIDARNDVLLESNSRSFFLTLRVLPRRVRRSIGLLYLLARVADTIADSKVGDASMLLDALEAWDEATSERDGPVPDLSHLASLQSNTSERDLLLAANAPVAALAHTPSEDLVLMRRCLGIIIGGQSLDLQRFGPANDRDELKALGSDEELDDYAYRVAGSVGEFWASMSLLHGRGRGWSNLDRTSWVADGVGFGKALQLINILRDVPEDLRFGRCYVPRPRLEAVGLEPEDLRDPANMDVFRPVHNALLDVADGHLEAAVRYTLALPRMAHRARVACMLPIVIGQHTIDLLRTSNVLDPTDVVKVNRAEIKRIMRRCLTSSAVPGGPKRVLTERRAHLR